MSEPFVALMGGTHPDSFWYLVGDDALAISSGFLNRVAPFLVEKGRSLPVTQKPDEEIESRLASMRPGEISDPIRSTGGYYVVTLREQREILRGDPDAIELDLKQILLPIGAQAPATEVETQTKLAEAIRETVTDCDDIETIGKELNSEDSGALGKLSLGDLPAKIRAAVGDLKVGDISLPVRTGAGVHLFMVCGRTGDAEQAPDPEAIREQIGNRRLTMLARRYLRDLRRDAVVEFR